MGVTEAPFVNTLRPRQCGRHFPDDTFKRIFLNENVTISLKISLKFVPNGPINNIPALVQIMAWRRPGDKPLSEPMMIRLPTHICVTRPQWVNCSVSKIFYLAKVHVRFFESHSADVRRHLSNMSLIFQSSAAIMGRMAPQITSLTIVYSTVYSDADQRNHQSSASLAFVRGIHRWPGHKGPSCDAENVSIWWRHHAIAG